MEAIMVKRSERGTYEIPGAATVQDWEEVRRDYDAVEEVEELKGWGWDAAWVARTYRSIDGRQLTREPLIEDWFFVQIGRAHV